MVHDCVLITIQTRVYTTIEVYFTHKKSPKNLEGHTKHYDRNTDQRERFNLLVQRAHRVPPEVLYEGLPGVVVGRVCRRQAVESRIPLSFTEGWGGSSERYLRRRRRERSA